MTDVYEVTLRIEAERQSDARDIADACAEAIRKAPLAKRLDVRVLGWGMSIIVDEPKLPNSPDPQLVAHRTIV